MLGAGGHKVIDPFEFKPILLVQPLEDDAFNEYFKSTKTGVCFVPEPYGDAASTLKADSGDFAKWLRSQHPDLPLTLPKSVPKILLHSADIWLPLVFLAGDTSMQIFLNMAASYLYDRAKGGLKTDQPRLHMSIIYQDKKQGISKKFEFSGDQESLAKAIKRFDLHNFFNDGP